MVPSLIFRGVASAITNPLYWGFQTFMFPWVLGVQGNINRDIEIKMINSTADGSEIPNNPRLDV